MTPLKETNLHKAKTKTRLPTVVKLDTGNNYHSLEHVDDLKKVDLFDDKKVELDFKIGNDIAAAAFFTRQVNIFFNKFIDLYHLLSLEEKYKTRY